ncbi:hypothetical protein [Parafrigoribacterium humi]|jgi:hypothetical protein|uniref:hypothetical protein n=1 Tax=Parafrigoribacterium humi TaxID=3144664 RepID=UPI0032ED929E
MTTITRQSRLSSSGRTVLLVAGAVVAVCINWGLASIAVASGAKADFSPLTIYVFAPFTVIMFVLAHLGWRIVRSLTARPAAVLKVLVPVFTVLSFVPDSILLATGFIPGTTLIAVVALATMHLVVVATSVLVSQRVAPVH